MAAYSRDGFDFEIFTAEKGAFVDEEGRPFQPAAFKIRGKGDSVYCQFVTEKSTGWTLLDESKSETAIKLKKAVASYSQEYSTDQILDGNSPMYMRPSPSKGCSIS